jgi:general secretion pathway protein L
MSGRLGIGVEVAEDAIRVAALERRLRRIGVVWTATFPMAEGNGGGREAALRRAGAEIAQRLGTRPAEVVVGLPRAQVAIRRISLPPVGTDALRQMLAFEAERHLPFPPESCCFDFQVVGREADGQATLVVGADREVVEACVAPLRDAGHAPAIVDAAPLALANCIGHLRPEARRGPVAVLRAAGAAVEVGVLVDGRPLAVRRLTADPRDRGAGLAEAIAGVEASATRAGAQRPRRWIVVGNGDAGQRLMAAARDAAGPEGIIEALPLPAATGGGVSPVAFGLALRGLIEVPLRINLIAGGQRRRAATWGPWLLVAQLALVLVLAAGGLGRIAWRERAALAEVDAQLAAMAGQVEEARRLGADLARLLEHLRFVDRVQREAPSALEVLRELSALLPSEVVVNGLTVDQQGLRMAGRAPSASNLLVILDRSPLFRDVEFTSPMMIRGHEAQEFQLRASIRSVAEARAAAGRGGAAPEIRPGSGGAREGARPRSGGNR